jgi:hypothetical protein
MPAVRKLKEIQLRQLQKITFFFGRFKKDELFKFSVSKNNGSRHVELA